MIVAKIGYCKWCGNENLHKISSEQFYCTNCNEYSRKDQLGYRDIKNTETVVQIDEKIRLTDKEYVELKCAFYSGFKYIARHEIGTVKLFKEKPVRNKKANNIKTGCYDTWVIGKYPIKDHSLYGDIKLGKYDFITWENGLWKITDLLNQAH